MERRWESLSTIWESGCCFSTAPNLAPAEDPGFFVQEPSERFKKIDTDGDLKIYIQDFPEKNRQKTEAIERRSFKAWFDGYDATTMNFDNFRPASCIDHRLIRDSQTCGQHRRIDPSPAFH